MAKNLQPVLQELHKAFNHMNEVFFEGRLPEVVIAIRSQGKRTGVNGWFTPAKVWSDGKEDRHEIVITAETLNREFMDIMRTLQHEMVHLYCHENDIKDTSRGGTYHNKAFKQACLDHGFEYKEDAYSTKIGWSHATLTESSQAIIKSWNLREGCFGLARKSFGTGQREKKKTNIIKWVCPSCGDIIRSSKPDIKAYCMKDTDKEGNEKEPCATYFEPAL